jgi:hypothetical protein
MQSKWASLWYMQQAQDVLEERGGSAESETGASRLESQAGERGAWKDEEKERSPESVWRRPERAGDSTRREKEPEGWPSLDYDALAPPSWDDAIRKGWQRALHAVRQQMQRRNAAVTVASVAVFLLLLVWAWWPAPASASRHLTWFESVLVELGLAQVPSRTPAAPTGNPNVRVWVDVHTALYYCPGSDLYGKTPGGQFDTQRNAQQDQFEPATGTVCE